MLGSCLWRGYVPAGETYWLCSLFAPVRELAGGCSWKQEEETCATTTSYATTLVTSHIPELPRLNAKKTVATCFQLGSKQAARKLKVALGGDVFVHDFSSPKYLGVTLDRSLTYRKHTENVRDKVKSRCNIISKLAGTDCGVPAPVLRTSAIALVYSVVEYWAYSTGKVPPTILGSAHLRTVKMLLTEAGQSNGQFCPRSNWKHGDLDWNLSCLINLYYYRRRVCVFAKLDQFLPVRSHFDTKRPVNCFHIATFPSPTFGPLFAFHCPLFFTKNNNLHAAMFWKLTVTTQDRPLNRKHHWPLTRVVQW